MTTLPQTTNLHLPRPVGPTSMAPATHAGAGPMGLAHQQSQLTGADIWRVIRANIWLIVGAVIASFVLGFVLNIYLNRFHARYTATGYVRVQPNPGNAITRVTGNNQDAVGGDDSATLIVEQRTQAQLIRSEGLFSKVLTNPNSKLRTTNWFKQFRTGDGTNPNIPEAKEDLQKHFGASPLADSKLIAVTMTFSDPKDCSTIVEEIVGQHLEDQRKNASEKIVEQSNALQQMKSRYDALARQSKTKNMGDMRTMAEGGAAGMRGASQKEIELAQLTTDRLKAENEYGQIRSAFESAQQTIGQGGTPGQVDMMVNNNMMVMQLKMNLAFQDIQLKSMAMNGPNSTQYVQVLASRNATEDQLNEFMTEERARNTSAYMDNLNGQLKGSQDYVDAITKQIDKIRLDMADMSARMAEYLSEKDNETALREQIRLIDQRLAALGTAQDRLEMSTVAWMQPPVTPDTPSFPVLKWTLAACVALGLTLSLGISFLREIMDTSVRSPRDIARVGQLNLLGMIPHEDDDPQAAGVPLPSVIYAAPASMLAEQFRQVRTRLQHTASLETTRSILVTSPGPEDGKSTVACNLAAGLALNGHRILLVDANFRRPELHKLFGLSNEAGFSNVLNAIENFESSVRQTKVPNLDIMTNGVKPANATELLESQLLTDFIDRALEEYDHVIFDSGPILVVSETVALAPRVDGVITVVRARNNSRGLLQRMRDNLRQLKAEHLGVVLNGVRSTGGGYYGRNIKTYYEYQNGASA